jgi:uncharacterized membrane protein (DUF4010 family)
MLAIATTTQLYFKPELRGMTKSLARRDLVSILQFSILTFVILPNQSYGLTMHLTRIKLGLVIFIGGIALAKRIASGSTNSTQCSKMPLNYLSSTLVTLNT